MNEGNERRNEGAELTREESKALAGALLDAMGLPEPDLDDEEREVIRRAVREWRSGKAAKDGEG